jgi:2-polyprenyl-6-methoxyphenol hydroxylase-like FAD-dependent oxidoreductase
MGDTTVLVVGAGPTGLTMAGELARHGASCRVVDELEKPTDKSKALGVHARTLEIFDGMGIVAAAVAAGRPMHGTNIYADGKRIAHLGFDELDTPYPFVLSLAQDETERLLAERAARLGVKVERKKKLVSLAQDDAGVTATFEGGETARAAFLVGCDGAHSAVRKALGLSFEGSAYEEGFVLGDVDLDVRFPDDEIHVFFSPEGVLACFPMKGEHRWRLIAEAPDAPAEPSLEWFSDLVRRRAGPEPKLLGARWRAAFRIHRRMVPSYRGGRVFVAGDAAHVHSPVGGLGMNTGIQDAYNLAWKLALVASGAARPPLLDSYDVERRPIAAATLSDTDLATRAITLRSPVAREIRNRVVSLLTSIDLVQRQMVKTASQMGLSYRASPIVREDRLPLAFATVTANRDQELPSVADWLDFGSAPHAGDRAPDVAFGDGGRRVFDLLRGTRHQLLLFDGAAATVEGYVRLDNIARRVRERHGAFVDAHVIVPRADKPPELGWDGSILFDTDGALHRRYGAGAECLYLVRPDGYVAYRAQPADEDRVVSYLQSIFL